MMAPSNVAYSPMYQQQSSSVPTAPTFVTAAPHPLHQRMMQQPVGMSQFSTAAINSGLQLNFQPHLPIPSSRAGKTQRSRTPTVSPSANHNVPATQQPPVIPATPQSDGALYRCPSSLCESPSEKVDQFFKTKMCVPYFRGRCQKGINCWYGQFTNVFVRLYLMVSSSSCFCFV